MRTDKLFLHICNCIPDLGQKLELGPIFEEINGFIENRLLPINNLPPANQDRINYYRIVGIPFLSISMSISVGELNTLLYDFLESEYNLIKIDNGAISITPDGWKYYYEERDRINSKNQIFIALSFDKSITDTILPKIKETINKTGYNYSCMKDYNHNEIIDYEMIRQIRDLISYKGIYTKFNHNQSGYYIL